ncbi:hypothetical protein Bbelb_115920 [Branchiostoma belcheri]|nr:hypothetical protein Bbelb_115920 [Branchiostoma belcheri]
MLRVCEKLQEADEKGRRYGLARAETGYLRALVDAMADTDRLAEVELLKTLGDVNVEKGRLGKDMGKFNTALAIYQAAKVRCYHEEQADGIEHRYHYTERLLQGLSSQGKEQPTEDKETTTPAKVAAKFQDLDKRRATGGHTDFLLVGYAQVMVEAIVNDDNMLETEAIKSLGDMYLKRGTETGDTRNLTRATALYNRALARCHNVHGTVVIVHRLLHTSKIRQNITPRNKCKNVGKRRASVRGEYHLRTESYGFGSTQTRRRTLSACKTFSTCGLRIHHPCVRVRATRVPRTCRAEEARVRWPAEGVRHSQGVRTWSARHAWPIAVACTVRCASAIARENSEVRLTESVRCTLIGCTGHARRTYSHARVASTRAKKQDVRGPKGHFSAAPSSDGTTSQVGERSYRRYIQTADRDLGNGDLEAAEKNIAAALKLVHDRSKPNKANEAGCLCRLGDVYVERGKRTGEGRKFTQAAALYNSSMARSDRDKQNLVTKLQETEKQFLRNTCNLDFEPCPYSSALDHIKELQNSRVRAKSQLETINQEHNPYQYDEDDPVVREVEIKRAEAIKNLFKTITVERREFIQVLTDECIAKLGPPPCKYAFIGMGSQATELVTPYSDLEFAILIEERKDDDDTRRYFLNLTHYLHLKVINLGETILPAMAIPSLNDFLSEDPEKDWFFDSVTPRGFAFDGFMPWASKTPFGRDETKSKGPVSLIQTPAKLAEYQHLQIALAEGYHLSDILRRVTYLTGDESLVNDYTDRIKKTVDRSPVLSRLSAILILMDNIEEIKNAEPTGQLLDVKKEIYRFPSVAVDVLSICCGITIASVWGMIEELHKTQRISDEDAHHLTVLISISAELRLRTYIANGGQNDRLSPLTEMKVQLDKHDVDDTFVQSVFYIPDSKLLFRYYYTAIPLKRCITNTAAKENPTTKTFPSAIFDTSSLTKGRITRQLLQLDTSRRHLEAALEEAGGDEENHFEVLFELGNVSSRSGDYTRAIIYYERGLTIGNTIYDYKGAEMNRNIASLLVNIGNCWSELGDQRKAFSYHERSLKMRKDIYGKTTPQPDITASLNNIGTCWSEFGDQKKAISYHERSLKMAKAIYGETTPHPDIASSLNNIGKCWSHLGDRRKAISYYERSLKMKKAIFGETTPHPDIASSLNNIGGCWSHLGDQRKAISYYERSLKMQKAIYGETTPHPGIAGSLNNIGACWNKLGYVRKAINYQQQSLKMGKAIYGETTPHPDIASSLNNIGGCWSYLGDQRKAISYYERSLEMIKALYGETLPHPDIASSLNNIGTCCSHLGDHRKAISYYERSLKMMKVIYGEKTPHPDIALLLNNIGNCCSDRRKAISYHEQSLKMRKAIYGETTPHPDIAGSLNSIGNWWWDLGDQRKAISYHEQSLKMMKSIYGETTPHPGIAGSLNNIGSCWNELGDQRKAISYHKQSLKMNKALYGETAPHPEIASLLYNIGNCWSKLGDQRKAISYHEQSLKMMKVIYGETMPHPDIASSLNNIGLCWKKVGDNRTAISEITGGYPYGCRQSTGTHLLRHRPDEQPMPARLLSRTGAGRGYITDGHRRNWDRSFTVPVPN